MKIKHAILFVLLLVGALTLHAEAVTVTATLDPAQISMGDSSQLTVTVSGSRDQPSVPTVDGLDINRVGTSTQIEFVNGTITANASSTYQVTPQREGTFVIPSIQVGGASSQPVTLTVGQGAAPPPSPPQNLPPPSSGPVVMPPQTSTADADGTSMPHGRFGWIQVNVPKKEFYTGELVPVVVKAYIPADLQASISDLPQFTSEAFTLDSLSTKPEQSEEIVNGRPYAVLSWHSKLTGVKAGDYPFSLQMPLSVIVPQQMPQGDADDMFNNFFRNAMASMGTKKEVTIQTNPQSLKVLPLPQADRPANFSGAVGQFDIEASATPTSVNTGDPITLRLKITGSGNFDRVSTDMLPSDSHWKTYSPKSSFSPADSVGYQGTKTFEQPIIPNDAGISSIPSVSFSYFDPEARRYVTRTSSPVAVTVSGGSLNPPPPALASSTPPTQPQPSPSPSPQPAPDDLRPNQIESGAYVSTLSPIYLNPWFIAGQSLPLLALLGGLAFIRRREHALHPQRRRAAAVQLAIRQQLAAMDEAMHHHQTDAFFIHARSALQQRLGQEWNMRPEAITLAEVEARLGQGRENIRPIFQMADQASYSDLHFEESDLRQWQQVILKELAEKNG